MDASASAGADSNTPATIAAENTPAKQHTLRASSSCDSSMSGGTLLSRSDSCSNSHSNSGSASPSRRRPSPSKRTVTAADTALRSRRKQPLRRPSLAGIFGIGQRPAPPPALETNTHDTNANANVASADIHTQPRDESSSDWDKERVDEERAKGTLVGTVKGTGSRRLRLRGSMGAFGARVGGATPSSAASPSPSPSTSSSPAKKQKQPTTLRLRPRGLSASLASSPSLLGDKPNTTVKPAEKPSLQPPRSPRVLISFSPSSSVEHPPVPTTPTCTSALEPAHTHDASTRRRQALLPTAAQTPVQPASLARLALSPENIRPLLGHARDVAARLNECIGEVREMMGGVGVVV
ncbi:hypothetical protein K439DRAFT_1631979 [Ramaria rubella]|nr:hypothetical protein K439DRAFT_1631979 [Ramaria rubella]